MQSSIRRKTSGRIGLKKDLLFYVIMLIWPVAQFCVFYIGVNFNSFFLSFRKITMDPGHRSYIYIWSIDGIQKAWELLSKPEIMTATRISLLAWVLGMFTGLPLGLLFSHYIAKKMPFSGFFRVLLFLPSIISAIVIATLYMYFLNNAIPMFARDVLGKEVMSLLDARRPIADQFLALFFYNTWIGFGVNVLMYANSMSGISPEMIEAANLDGATGLREFWHISLPQVYPTLSVFIVTGIAGIFTNQFNLFTFYGTSAPYQTFGYFLYKETLNHNTDLPYFPKLAAFGLMMAIVAIPLTFLVRWLLEKFGPTED
ncbi:MAG: sugar ABC transporter permease [Clostridia bacterium]|nr:sugar ABC transporter permease [Clostridia bacterium]